MLEFKNVSWKAGKKDVIKNISFVVEPGELVSIIGASGAGKSTIFKLLIGEIRPTHGDIQLNNFSLKDISLASLQNYRRQIGIVFQDFRLLSKKTTYENIAFPLEVCGQESEVRRKIPKLLQLVGLEDKKKQFPHELSGGERQRLAIARALVHEPQILIADEPTGNLDPKNAREIAELFYNLNKKNDLTILIATHDPFLVKFLSPRVIRLQEGEVLFDRKHCSPQEAFEGII